jgi:hypothetical protein
MTSFSDEFEINSTVLYSTAQQARLQSCGADIGVRRRSKRREFESPGNLLEFDDKKLNQSGFGFEVMESNIAAVCGVIPELTVDAAQSLLTRSSMSLASKRFQFGNSFFAWMMTRLLNQSSKALVFLYSDGNADAAIGLWMDENLRGSTSVSSAPSNTNMMVIDLVDDNDDEDQEQHPVPAYSTASSSVAASTLQPVVSSNLNFFGSSSSAMSSSESFQPIVHPTDSGSSSQLTSRHEYGINHGIFNANAAFDVPGGVIDEDLDQDLILNDIGTAKAGLVLSQFSSAIELLIPPPTRDDFSFGRVSEPWPVLAMDHSSGYAHAGVAKYLVHSINFSNHPSQPPHPLYANCLRVLGLRTFRHTATAAELNIVGFNVQNFC